MKIEAKITTLRCCEKIRVCMKYLPKKELVRIHVLILHVTVDLVQGTQNLANSLNGIL